MKWYNLIIINLLFIKNIISKNYDYDAISKIEEIKRGLSELNITNKEEISQKEFVKLVRHLMNGGDKSKKESPKTNVSFGIEDQLELQFAKEVLRGVPEKIKVKELSKYLDPKKLELIMNKILNNFNFDKMFKDIGDELNNLKMTIENDTNATNYNNKKVQDL